MASPPPPPSHQGWWYDRVEVVKGEEAWRAIGDELVCVLRRGAGRWRVACMEAGEVDAP